MSQAFTLVARPRAETYCSDGGDRGSEAAAAASTSVVLDVDDESAGTAMPGQTVASGHVYMRGHGTFIDSSRNEIVSTLAGTVQRVNKLVSVHPARTRYRPDVGDLVVGRVVEVQARRWRVDIGAKTDATLQLSSINLPGGVQRKKVESDELQMRTFFQEGDLLVAEVQSAFQDGSVALHTRSLRYGKLRNGMLVTVPPVLMRRLRSHFVTLPGDAVDMVAGLNGFVWVAKHVPFDAERAEADNGASLDGVYSDVNETIPAATRRSIARAAFVLSALAHHGCPISDASVASGCAALDALAPSAFEPSGELAQQLVDSL